MNAEQAKSIALTTLLDKLGFYPAKTNGDDYWYLSPLRHEKTASFHVNAQKNVWYDHGTGQCGTVVDFVCAYLKSCGENNTVADALRWLGNMTPSDYKVTHSARESFMDASSQLTVEEILPLQNKKLIAYLKKRGIPDSLAKKYLKEIHVYNKLSHKKFFALAVRNEDKGYEWRNELLKGCIGTKTVTFIRGAKPLTKEVHVFEGVFDYLSALLFYQTEKMEGDCIILHSSSCLRQGYAYIKTYDYCSLFSWMDNDAAGKKATVILDDLAREQNGLRHRPMNKHYTDHKDVNEWHMHRLNLPKPK